MKSCLNGHIKRESVIGSLVAELYILTPHGRFSRVEKYGADSAGNDHAIDRHIGRIQYTFQLKRRRVENGG